MRRLDDLAARIAAAAPDKKGPPFPVPDLPLVSPADSDAPPAIGWTTVREFVEMMSRWWWPGWSVRRAISGEVPDADGCAWSCRLHAAGRMHDVPLVASMP